jgi:hypothetical protein
MQELTAYSRIHCSMTFHCDTECNCSFTALFTALFTAYSLPIHCHSLLFTAYSPFLTHSEKFSCFVDICNLVVLKVYCLFTTYSLPIDYLFATYALPIRCLCNIYSLPIHCAFTAYSLPIHRLFAAYSLPIRCLFLETARWAI